MAAALAVAGGVQAQSSSKVPALHTLVTEGQRTIDIIDLCPRFLDFYSAAADAKPEARWQLWKQKYDFAAVPPTPAGSKLARQMLDNAWPRYTAVLPTIRQGASKLRPDPKIALREVADLLGLDANFEMQLVVYVGAFDGNTFTTVQGGKPMVAVPIEMSEQERELALRHELTHAVQIRTAGLTGGWERSIAETIFQEGLAMRATQALLPGRPERDYLHEFEPGWYERGMKNARAIIRGIQPALARSDSDTVERFTMGKGTTGISREAYVVGWWVVGELLREGRTFPQLARVPSSQMVEMVRGVSSRLLQLPAGALEQRR